MTPEITKTDYQGSETNSRFIWVIFACLTVFVYFLGLTIPFVGPDEPRYAQVAREMLNRGDWITPTLGGFNWFEKPPLLYWLEMVSYKLFGISEFAARLGPALFGLGTIASLGILGNQIVKGFGRYLGLIAASTLALIAFSHGASFDVIITFPITAALVSFFIWHLKNDSDDKFQPKGVSIWLILFYVFMGIGLLAKGLIGVTLPLAIVGVFYLFLRRLPSRVFVVSVVWGTLIAVAIASIWYLPMYQRHGYQFIDEFFIQHHFQRFTSNKYLHPQPFYFFLWVLPLMTLPWLPFFLAAIWNSVKDIIRHKDVKDISDKRNDFISTPSITSSYSHLFTFALAWLFVPLIFFSFSGSKLPGYILPAAPPTIIVTSIFVFDLIRKRSKWRRAILLVAATTLGLVILLLIFAVPRFAESDSIKTLIQAADERGYVENRVLTLHTISHSAEFYAAGRSLRDAKGSQRYLSGVGEVINEIKADNGRTVLVIVPVQYLSQLTDDQKLNTEAIRDNGELAIAAVSLK